MNITVNTHETGDRVYHKGMQTNGVIVGITEDNKYEFKGACGTVVEATDADLTV